MTSADAVDNEILEELKSGKRVDTSNFKYDGIVNAIVDAVKKKSILQSIREASENITNASRRGHFNGIIMHVSSPEHRQVLESLGYHEVGQDLWKKK